MRGLLLIFSAMLWAESAFGMARDITTCESYILAPPEIKPATHGLINANTPKKQRTAIRAQIKTFVDQSEPGLESMVGYLKSLREDSPFSRPHSIEAFAERLLVEYLMKPGNEGLALRHLPELLNAFWMDFIFGDYSFAESGPVVSPNRFKEGYAWMETVVPFLSKMVSQYPDITRAAWEDSYEKFLPELIDLPRIEIAFEETAIYLESPDSGPPEVRSVARNRIKYLESLIEEMEYSPPKPEIDSLLKYYRLQMDAWPANPIFERDMLLFEGTDLRAITPMRALVFLYRLSKRQSSDFPLPTFDKLEDAMKIIKVRLHQITDARAASG